ncbi:hypothetical protein K438DRAFT_1940706 [Mycena galopus ATCC 62051]|nr:hypothetical protein K438DRAFT_1940706 [Mycena galopus ATCC 62051]
MGWDFSHGEGDVRKQREKKYRGAHTNSDPRSRTPLFQKFTMLHSLQKFYGRPYVELFSPGGGWPLRSNQNQTAVIRPWSPPRWREAMWKLHPSVRPSFASNPTASWLHGRYTTSVPGEYDRGKGRTVIRQYQRAAVQSIIEGGKSNATQRGRNRLGRAEEAYRQSSSARCGMVYGRFLVICIDSSPSIGLPTAGEIGSPMRAG